MTTPEHIIGAPRWRARKLATADSRRPTLAARSFSPVTRGVLKRGVQLLVSGLVLALAMFVSAGRRDWWQAWAFLGIYFGAIAFNGLVVLRDDPELIAEAWRGSSP